MHCSKAPYKFYLFLALHLHVTNGMVRIYGQNCDEGEPCLGAHVSCLAATGICGCSRVDDMIFDHSVGDCVATLGRGCDRDAECIEGAVCDKKICKCEKAFYASSDGICRPKKVYKEICSNDLECGVPSHIRNEQVKGRNDSMIRNHRPLICLDGICQCDRRVDVFSETKGICVGLVDTDCKIGGGDDCTDNAECRKGHNNGNNGNNGNGKSVGLSCQCQNGFAKTSQGLCGLAYGQRGCDGSGNTCADIHFMCIDGKCTCKYPLHQVYDEKSKECLSLISGPCTFPRNILNIRINDFQRCVKNAHCVDKGFYSECECKKHYQPTMSGTCSPSFGQPCSGESPGVCDPDGVAQLFCRNGICDCLDLLQVYDPIIKKCRGFVGTRCSMESPFCVEYASCVMPDKHLAGKCLCDKYAQEIHNRTCVTSTKA